MASVLSSAIDLSILFVTNIGVAMTITEAFSMDFSICFK